MKRAFSFESKGNFNKTESFLKRAKKIDYSILDYYGALGVEALASATPKDSGETASSWSYRIVESKNGVSLEFLNSNLADGWCPIAILLQYGHATGTGGWVQGRDYINPVVRPIFDEIAQLIWKGVTKG